MCLAEQSGDEHQPTGLYGWRFNWHGHELWVEMQRLEWGGKAGEQGWSRWELRRIGSMKQEGVIVLGDNRHLPPDLESHRDEILKDLHDAFETHHGLNGIDSRYSSYKLTLELAKGV
jgi:hypothetical protein